MERTEGGATGIPPGLDPAERELLAAAAAARQRAYAPYSGYAVGAAVRSADGRVFAGCNVENASYGLTCCAERAAVFAAVAAGVRRLTAVAVVAEGAPPFPCGACRQVLAEFAGDGVPVLVWEGTRLERTTVGALLPRAFRLRDPGEG